MLQECNRCKHYSYAIVCRGHNICLNSLRCKYNFPNFNRYLRNSLRKFRNMNMQKKFFAFVSAVIVSLFLTFAALGQSQTTGNVEGTVTDPNGAVVPAVTLTL